MGRYTSTLVKVCMLNKNPLVLMLSYHFLNKCCLHLFIHSKGFLSIYTVSVATLGAGIQLQRLIK